MSKTTIVFYNVINDREDKNTQNMFYVSKPINLVTLYDIKNEFPLIGTYHFRFKIIHNNNHFWVDINDDSSSIPSLNSCIYAKVLRLSWVDYKKKKELERQVEEAKEKAKEKEIIKEKIMTPNEEKYKINKREPINYETNVKNTNDYNEHNKSKNNIDMLLFETTPNKSNTSNKNTNDGVKDQNYFDLMFN